MLKKESPVNLPCTERKRKMRGVDRVPPSFLCYTKHERREAQGIPLVSPSSPKKMGKKLGHIWLDLYSINDGSMGLDPCSIRASLGHIG